MGFREAVFRGFLTAQIRRWYSEHDLRTARNPARTSRLDPGLTPCLILSPAVPAPCFQGLFFRVDGNNKQTGRRSWESEQEGFGWKREQQENEGKQTKIFIPTDLLVQSSGEMESSRRGRSCQWPNLSKYPDSGKNVGVFHRLFLLSIYYPNAQNTTKTAFFA